MATKRNTIIKWTILTLLVAYACCITAWARQEAASHVCTGIEVSVEGDSMPDAALRRPMDSVISRGVLLELQKYPGKIVGSPFKAINTHDIEKYLRRLSNFETVNCMLASDGKLSVRVVPMVPVMRVFFSDNSYYINKDGKHIDSNAEFFNDVPVVSGRFTRRFRPVDVLPLIRFINGDPLLSEITNMIVANDPDNLIIVPRITGHVINFGDTTRLEEKKHALELFYHKVLPYKGWAEYDTISVKFRDQIVATRRDKTRLNVPEEDTEEIDLEEATLPDGGNATAIRQSADSAAATAPADTNNHKKTASNDAPKKKP